MCKMEEMECKKMLNEEQANALFNSNAVLIYDNDRVPVSRAVELFGVEPVKYVGTYADTCLKEGIKSRGNSFFVSWYLAGKVTLEFLTLDGFMLAVTYHNAILQAEKENPPKAVQA